MLKADCSNYILDTDSEATPSGYLSGPEDDSIESDRSGNMNDQTRCVHTHTGRSSGGC